MAEDNGKRDPLMLAALLDHDPSPADAWSRDELAAMLRHELALPVTPGPEGDDGGRRRMFQSPPGGQDTPGTSPAAAAGLMGRSFGEVLRDPHPPPELLARACLAQQRRRHNPASAVPPEVPTALYYAAVTASRRGGGHPIELDAAQWRAGVGWLLAQRWVQEPLRTLFDDALNSTAADRHLPALPSSPGSPEIDVGELPYVPPDPTVRPRSAVAAPSDDTEAPSRIGSYTLGEPLGEGGMGVVYQAEQDNPRRTVALKVIRPSLLTGRALRRFGHEAEILGRLQHPNIARIYEAGTSGPQPFFAMELVRGTPVTQFVAERKLAIRQRVALMATVCDAVSYAHQRGVVHRDLKPANILVDEAGAPKVLDFGVARLLDAEPAQSLDTLPGHLVGTLQYMAPEQAAGDGRDVDTRADVYGLGVILYEVLAGQPPYDLRGRSLADGLRELRETEAMSLARVSRWLRGDLSTIVAKAMAREPARRYAGASNLASDLRRYLDHQPIAARPAGAAYTLGKFARRHRTLVFSAFAVLACLVAGVIGTASQARRAIAAEREVREKLRGSLLNQARAERFSGQPGRRFNALRALTEAARIRPGDDLRDEAIAAMALTDVTPLAAWPHPGFPPAVVTFDPSTRHYVVGDKLSGDLEVRLTADGSLVRRLPTPGAIAWVTPFSRDGKRLAVKYHPVYQPWPCQIRVWDLASGEVLMDVPGPEGDVPFDFSPAGDILAIGEKDGSIGLYEIASGGREVRRLPPGVWARSLKFSPDGRYLAAGGRRREGVVEVRDLASGEPAMRVAVGRGIQAVAWHPGGLMVAAASYDLLVHVWDFPSGRSRATLKGHTHLPTDVCFSSAGDLLASYGWDSQLRLWRPATGKEVLAVPNARMFGERVLQFSAVDDRLAYATDPGGVGLYALAAGNERVTVPLAPISGNYFRGADFSPDGRWVAIALDEGMAVYDRTWRTEVVKLLIGPQGLAAFAADGASLVTWGDGGLRRWPFKVGAGPGRVELGPPAVLRAGETSDAASGSLSHDRSLLVINDYPAGQVHLYDLNREALVFTTPCPFAGFVAVHPDGPLIAAANQSATNPMLTVWDVRRGGKPEYKHRVPNRGQPAFTTDGRLLAVGSSEWNIVFRNGPWSVKSQYQGSTDGGLAVHPGGHVVAFSAGRGLVRLMSATDDRVFASLPGGKPVCFSSDGSLLLTHDGDLQIWDLNLLRRELAAMNLPLELPGVMAVPSARKQSR